MRFHPFALFLALCAMSAPALGGLPRTWGVLAPLEAIEQLDPSAARLQKAALDALDEGMTALRERRDAEAVAALQRALQFNPRLVRARALLGQAQRRTGDLHGAIRTYETLVTEVPDEPAVLETLNRWRRESELHDRMELAVGELFTVSFEGPAEAALANEALAALDRAYWRICDVLATYPVTSVRVVLYSGEQFRDITRSPTWAAAAYDGQIRVPVRGALKNPKELERVLAHEFVHALIHSVAPRGVPAWLNEGLAAALESDDLEWAVERARKPHAPVPLASLQTSFGRLSGDQAQIAYATSALAARRLIDEAGGAAVTNLLRDLGEGVAFESAFLHRIQRTFTEFQAMLSAP
jgi:tetratricopeptide (TPR) repeat protein